MTGENAAIGALVLVPIVIVVSIAFIALKASQLFSYIGRLIRGIWDKYSPWSTEHQAQLRRRQRRSNYTSSQLFGDSWQDLDSIHSRRGFSSFIGQSPRINQRTSSDGDDIYEKDTLQDTPSRIWHPTRSSRLAWSFTNPRSQSPNLFGLSNVVRPSPVARRPGSQSIEDVELLTLPKGARVAPPSGVDRPLAVHKKRQGRGSVLNRSLEGSEEMITGSAISDLIKKNTERNCPLDDPDLTPKAPRQIPRTMSAGVFLKSEFHGGRFDPDFGRHSVRAHRSDRSDINPADLGFAQQARYTDAGSIEPPISERRFSRSKSFLRAIGGRNAETPKAIRRTDSTNSKATLIRRLSRARHNASGSSESSYEGSVVSADSRYSFEPTNLDDTDARANSRVSSYESQSSSLLTPNSASSDPDRDALILCPQIIVTPELSSVDSGNCVIWIAIEITGMLRIADGSENRNQVLKRYPSLLIDAKLSDPRRYGRLHSMRIDLHPSQGCTVLELVGNLHESKSIEASEALLILARIRLNKIISSPNVTENSSDELIADLQNHLGNTISSYMTVQLTYKHSGFPNHKDHALSSDGMCSHTTRLQTEATATIRRCNLLSAWSPRTSQTINEPVEPNPLIKLVETHLTGNKRREVLKQLSDDRPPPSLFARRFDTFAGGSSEETVKASPRLYAFSTRINSSLTSSSTDGSSKHSRDNQQTQLDGPFARLPPAARATEPQMEEIDPARKIWSEMRRTSRGGRNRHERKSISTDHYFSLEDDTTPTRASSGDNSVSTSSSGRAKTFGARQGNGEGGVDQERNRIMEVALRNKRSLGADTLRSIAPSVVKNVGRTKGGTMGGLGLGVGRTWGWGPPWW